MLREVPRRTFPVIAGDNDGFDVVKGEDGRWRMRSEREVHSERPGREHLVGRCAQC